METVALASLLSGVSDADLSQYRHLCLLQLFQDDRMIDDICLRTSGTRLVLLMRTMYGPPT